MPKKSFFFFAVLLTQVIVVFSQNIKSYTVVSPDNKITVIITTGDDLRWQVNHGNDHFIQPSAINIELEDGTVLGKNPKLVSSKKQSVNQTITAIAYKKKSITDQYNELTLAFSGDYGVIFRVYNDGAAYRFFTKKKNDIVVRSERSEFNFNKDYNVLIPHTSDLRENERYSCSFEEFYTDIAVSRINKDTLGYLPLLIKLDNNKKAVLVEADVQDYPAMFVQSNPSTTGLKAAFAPYPTEEALGIRNKINYMVKNRADYIAKVSGTKNFPWRAVVISEQDKDLLNSDMVQKLAGATKLADASWIKPGKVAWDWWNNWNITHVDFKAGINNPTYKYYIDFAAANKLEYIVLDEGWSDDWDLTKLKPEINLAELIAYGRQKNVDLILWSTWYALAKDIEGLCKRYAEMGIKGFKVDFLDRNDQKMIASCYEMASIAAKYHLLLDFHGMFPPQGLQRTWPNVINFEAVRGMEYMKWSADDRVVPHDVSLPFIRMVAGPLDYTPGGTRNATKGNARPNNSLPMSLGTRCHQMAMYIVFEAPLQMLADNPTAYMREQECTDFIAKIPTTFDETIALEGKVTEYAVIARKKGNTWYIGGMNNWDAKDVTIDLSFLGDGNYEAEIFKDGINAGRDARDYKKEVIRVSSKDKLAIPFQSGGGWAAIIK